MKPILTLVNAGIAACSLLATLASAQPAQQYTVTDLGTLPGGTLSQAVSINRDGFIAGFSTSGSAAGSPQHAALWFHEDWYTSPIMDIGTPGLGGPNSSAVGVNMSGQAAGSAESSAKYPNNENFCVYGTGLECLPFLWQDGTMTQLPLLGGNNGLIVGTINNHGEVPGIAENATMDRNCPSGVTVSGTGPQSLDFEAVIWGPKPGQIRELHPLTGDTVGMAVWMNDNGQAVGATGTCANTVLPPLAYGPHAVLWEADGSVTDLGNLGGTAVNIGLFINNRGHVVGVSSLAGASTVNVGTDAFLWTRLDGMQDLGTLPGDVGSVGLGINDDGVVVGASFDAMGNPRGFVWQNGAMTDLNTLAPADSPLYLLFAETINSSGAIVGFGATSAGDIHAFVAVPALDSGNRVIPGAASSRVLSDEALKVVRQRLSHGRFGSRLLMAR
jgi:probable HAF family extracellular repeat protein